MKCNFSAHSISENKEKGEMLKRIVSGLMLTLLLIGMLAFATNIQPAKTEPNTIVVPDNFPTIQEAINNAVDGDTIFVKAGIYYEHVVVNKTVTLVGEEVSTTIVDGNSTGHVINVVSDNVIVTGLTVQRSGNIHWPALEAGICLNHSEGCVISSNRLIDNGFCGISLLYSQQNKISNNTVARSSWGGIHLLTSSHNVISNNTVDSTYGGINGHASSHYNNFTDNIITNSTHGMFYNNANYNSILRNSISDIAVEGIWLQDQVSYNVVAENNLINNTVAIRVQGPNYNNILSGNVITGAEYGIEIQNSARYTRIADNIIVDNRAGSDPWRAGIRLDYALDSRIYSNIIKDNYYGILLYSYSPLVFVYGNNITDNEYGLRVASGGSNYLNVSDNIVMNNRGYGIGLTGFSSGSNYAAISRNLIVNNSDGIALGQYSNYNNILQNNISQNDHGFYIEYSTQNTIWGNNIVDNDQQVYVSTGSVNNWDNGYPIGGNYWSDYSGVDVKSGSDQDLPGSDAIGDTPYAIDASNRDRYPLMNPRAERKVGVEVGDWVEYGYFEVVWNSTDPDAQPPQDYDLSNSLEWTRTEVQAISGTNITFEFLIHFRNGTEQTNTLSIDVKTGKGFPFYYVSANLNAGDTTYEGDATYSPGPRINETISVKYAEEFRETNHLNITRFFADFHGWKNYSESYNFYWDRATGVLTKYSYQRSFLSGPEDYVTFALASFRIVDTNLWRVKIFGDINGDYKVDIRDIAMAGLAFGSTPDHPRWNPQADLNQDGKVDIKDIATIAKNFGKTLTP